MICNLDKLLEISTGKTQLYYKFPHERMHMKWAKYILGVNNKSTNIAISAELGLYPLILGIINTGLKYLFQMSNTRTNSLLHDSFQSNIQSVRNGEVCWLSFIENLAKKSNFHSVLDVKKASTKTRNYLQTIFDQQFHKDLFNDMRSNDEGNKIRTYRKLLDLHQK